MRLRDVARVELTGESFEIESFYNGKPAVGMGIRLAAGANALDTADAVRKRLDELSADVPARARRSAIRVDIDAVRARSRSRRS